MYEFTLTSQDCRNFPFREKDPFGFKDNEVYNFPSGPDIIFPEGTPIRVIHYGGFNTEEIEIYLKKYGTTTPLSEELFFQFLMDHALWAINGAPYTEIDSKDGKGFEPVLVVRANPNSHIYRASIDLLLPDGKYNLRTAFGGSDEDLAREGCLKTLDVSHSNLETFTDCEIDVQLYIPHGKTE